MNVHQISARTDNYIYILEDPKLDHCAVIDATDFEKIAAFCESRKRTLSAIFVTHHHPDHINAISALRKKYHCKVYGFEPDFYRIPDLTDFVAEGQSVFYGPNEFKVFETPGHTLGHISYYNATHSLLFCGDVIFRFGCGRLFEGTPEMMMASLKKLCALPDSTGVYCAHEYTLDNLAFCRNLEPDSSELAAIEKNLQGLRKQGLATVPFLLKEQKEQSPFLRWNDGELRKQLQIPNATDVETFAEVRSRRNRWQKQSLL